MILTEAKNTYLGKMVDIVWEMPKSSGLGIFAVLDTRNVKVSKLEEFFDGTIMAYFEDKIYVPVRVERLKLNL